MQHDELDLENTAIQKWLSQMHWSAQDKKGVHQKAQTGRDNLKNALFSAHTRWQKPGSAANVHLDLEVELNQIGCITTQ
jgi:hypothetical protein